MTYGRVLTWGSRQRGDGAVVSHSAELLRANFARSKAPLIRPSATFSPRGKGLMRIGVARPARTAHGERSDMQWRSW
jgi:hypothetical protein